MTPAITTHTYEETGDSLVERNGRPIGLFGPVASSGRIIAVDMATSTVSHHWLRSEAIGAIYRRTVNNEQGEQEAAA